MIFANFAVVYSSHLSQRLHFSLFATGFVEFVPLICSMILASNQWCDYNGGIGGEREFTRLLYPVSELGASVVARERNLFRKISSARWLMVE